jgi:hypothetical protein
MRQKYLARCVSSCGQGRCSWVANSPTALFIKVELFKEPGVERLAGIVVISILGVVDMLLFERADEALHPVGV